MGIGFDLFKAHIGYSLAGGVMDSISDALEKNAAENAAREKAAKEASDRNDMLRTLVFMSGNNIALDRSGKKNIATVLSNVYDENISLFSIEDKIDAAYSEIKSVSPKNFFSSIAAINSDREQTCFMYAVMMILYMQLSDDGTALPVHAYNLALIKKFFAISRSELAQCYEGLGNKLEKDIDDIADVFEELTSEETIKAIEAENPTLVYEEPAQELPAPEEPEQEQENPAYTSAQFEEIKSLCYDLLPKFGEGAATSLDKKNRMKMLAERLVLADEAPEKIIAAKESFAQNCKDDIPLLMYDETLKKNGTQGFLLTNKKLYIGNAYEEPAEIDLSEIHTIESQAKMLSSFIAINGIKFETSTLLKKQLPLMAEFLQKAIPLAMKVEQQ